MEEQKKNPAQGLSESEQVQVRRQKLADLQAAGHDPFTLTKYPQDAYSADLKAEFADLPNETDSGKTVALAGRMMSKRVMGKASFAHLRDDKGDIQLYVRRDELGEEPYAAFKKHLFLECSTLWSEWCRICIYRAGVLYRIPSRRNSVILYSGCDHLYRTAGI